MAPLLLIGALPLIALALNPNLFFSPLDFVDPWVYLGYFHHLREFSGSMFKGLYFANRLSWLLPGALFFKVLSPLVANYVLRLAVAYTALYSLYFAMRRLASEGLALAAAVTLAANPFFWLRMLTYQHMITLGGTELLHLHGIGTDRNWRTGKNSCCCALG